jgi:hypothetical protein
LYFVMSRHGEDGRFGFAVKQFSTKAQIPSP